MDVKALVERMAAYGLEEGEATVYYHLSRMGGARAVEVANAAKRKRPDTYRLLANLVLKGFAEKTLERPTRFLPIDIETALERLVAVRREQADELARQAVEVAQAWPQAHADGGPGQQRFTVYQGREQVQGLIRRMFAAARDEITVVASPGGLANLGLLPFFSSLEGEAAKQVHVRVLTKPDGSRHESLVALQGIASIRHAELPSYHQMIIVDAKQIALFISSGRKVSTQGDVRTVLWLNTPDFVLAQKALFDEVWATALATEETEAAELEGRLPIETRLLRGRWQRLDRLRRMVGQAKRTVWLRVPGEEVLRWGKSGLARSLQARAAAGVSIVVWTDGGVTIPGLRIIAAPPPAVMECIVDGQEALAVYGARSSPDAMAYDGEWGVWSTHPDAVVEMARGFEASPEAMMVID